MASIIDELLTNGSVTPEVLSELLRRKEDYGLAMEMGNSSLSPLGKNLREGALETAAGLGKTKHDDALAQWKAQMLAAQNAAELEAEANRYDADRASKERIAAGREAGALERARLKAGAGANANADFTGQIEQLERNASLAEQAMDRSNWRTTGLAGAGLGMIPGTDAYKLEKFIQPLLSGEAMASLQRLREQAAAVGAKGSGLGQITEKELNMLRDAYVALDRATGEEDFDRALSDIATRNRAIITKLKNWTRMNPAAGGGAPSVEGQWDQMTDPEYQPIPDEEL